MHTAVLSTLARLELPTPEESVNREHVTLHTEAIERRVRIDLQPITPALSQLRVTVVIGLFQKDVATATTLVDVVAETVGSGASALSRP